MHLLLAAAAAALTTPYDSELLLACSAPLGQQPERANLSIIEDMASDEELGRLRVIVKGTDHFMLIYSDAGSERIARARAACLGEQIAAVARIVGDARQGAEWHSVVFTQDQDYIPPRIEGQAVRWPIHVQPDGELDAANHEMVVGTMPHEQVHDWQGRNGTRLPRWVSEGHAFWVSSKIAPLLDPIVAAHAAADGMARLAAVDEEIDLASWGSVRPRREAILRQVSPEDRARMETDPLFTPPGPFTFTQDDFELDMSNEVANYAAAEEAFRRLEARYGQAAVHAWMEQLTASGGTITHSAVMTSLEEHFGDNATDLLTAR